MIKLFEGDCLEVMKGIPNEWDNYCGICGQAIDWEE